MTFTTAQSEQQHGRIFQEIVVEYPSICPYPEYKGKPYFSIKYMEDGHCIIGYSTYEPEVLSSFLKEYFLSPVHPEIIRCKDCGHYDDNRCEIHEYLHFKENDFCSYAERKEE